MKILFISTLFPVTDGEYVTSALKDFVDEWIKEGTEVLVLKPIFKASSVNPIATYVHVIKGIRIPILETFFLDPIEKLKELNFTPDIVVAHMFKSFIWAPKVSFHFKCPLVVGIHNTDLFFSHLPHVKFRMNKVFNESSLIACRSDAIKKHFVTQFPRFEAKAMSCPSGIPAEEIEPTDFFSKKIETLIESKKIVFATVGKLQKLKNVDQVILALSKLPTHINWEYNIVGDGPELDNLKNLTTRLGLETKVKFLGWMKKDQVSEILNHSHIFVMISAPETFGLVYLEAMAKGNLIIGAKGWGIDGVIIDGENGFLCTPKDVNELHLIMTKICSQLGSAELRKLSTNTYSTIKNFTRKETSNTYLQFISKCL